MPFIVIHRPTGKIMATIDRDDIPAWCSLVEIPLSQAPEFATEPIPSTLILPRPRPRPPINPRQP